MSDTTPGNGFGPLTGGTLNMWSNVNDVIVWPVDSPNYIDLSQARAYSFAVTNPTNADITSGRLVLQGADAREDNPCEPDTWYDLDPVAGCAPLVTGEPEVGPVSITITPERPIRARSLCKYSAPCPRKFFRVQATGLPAGVSIIAVLSHLVRTDWSHLGPWGGIPQPLQTPIQLGGWGRALPPPSPTPPGFGRVDQPTTRTAA